MWLLLALLAAAAALARLGWQDGWQDGWSALQERIPRRWNPWAALQLDEPPGLLTRYKLGRAAADPALCRATLAQSRLRHVPVADQSTGPGCGFDNAVRIDGGSIAFGQPFVLSCRAALSLAMWERHVLHQAATAHLAQDVVAVEHLGSYACRNLYGREGNRRSRHATADALDIAGVVLADGQRIRLRDDWAMQEPDADRHAGPDSGASRLAQASPRAQANPIQRQAAGAQTQDSPAPSDPAGFLRALRDGACDYFDVVLGPDYNQAHADHFHLDQGGGRACR